MSNLQNLTIHFPRKLTFGNGCIAALADDLVGLGCSSVLIITIKPLQSQLSKLVDDLERKNITVHINTDVEQEPSYQDFEQLMLVAVQANPDAVIGIGGGSVLDVAKLVAAQLNNSQSLQDIVGIGLLKGRTKTLICAPATSGTGSEVSPNAILVDDSDHQKKGIISPYLVPDIVYVDPLLSMSVPPHITAATGLDALIHCIEAYTNKFSHPLIDMYAIEGIRLIAANIVQAVNNGSDEHARAQVSMGSLLGGFCLGPVNTAAVHALSYPLGSSFNLAHGLSNALLLPYVMEFNYPSAAAKYAQVAIALGCQPQAKDMLTAKAGIAKIEQLVALCGIPARLREVNIPQDAIPEMAVNAMKITRLLKNNPREVTYTDAVDIYNAAY
ncbi:alcohol dehydrogenase class IV [Mucilaginibacter gracilis]|uniref:Alcohol dehydrogenase class IV n=1 Tax=Mucilaginibacter gracilis TaxID=423350 RepID=A0A495J7H2_9SPHI|nr:iron-containing alcohol dehydrogenase [Mucilaginibacter gracilis]RKR84358.1 alcohol dehydrogenase class IV [Mucilaginibacter gracilis]